MSLEKLRLAVSQTETNITELQKETGDYKKGVFYFNDLEIVIENPKGSFRSGVDRNGNTWKNEIKNTYGFIKSTIGSDGDEVDVFISDELNRDFVFIVFQTDDEKVFDEHKVMLGFNNKDDAEKAYLSNYDKDWKNYNQILSLTQDDFKKWLANKKSAKYEMTKEIKKTITLEGEVIKEETLKDLQLQAGDSNSYDILEINIASPGGDVSEGVKEMLWANSLTESGKIVSTIVTANAFSIASLIMLAATPGHRKIARNARVMVHNPMKPELSHVNASELEAYAKELRDLEEKMYVMYNIFTGLDRETIKNLMDNETYLNAEEAVKYGFADTIVDIEERPEAVAMANNNKSDLNMKSTLNVLNSVIAMVSGKDVVNQLYYDTIGGEIEIYQKNPAQYEVGDKTNVQEGERTLSDGSKVLIENFIIKDITKGMEAPEQFTETVIDEVVAPEAPVEPVVEPEVVSADEPVEPAVEPEVVSEVVVENPVVEEIVEKPSYEDKLKAFEATINEMALKISEMSLAIEDSAKDYSAKFEAIAKSNEENLKKASNFENLATEAIDVLAKNTVSNFKTEPAVVASVAPQGGSIFQKLRAQAQAVK